MSGFGSLTVRTSNHFIEELIEIGDFSKILEEFRIKRLKVVQLVINLKRSTKKLMREVKLINILNKTNPQALIRKSSKPAD